MFAMSVCYYDFRFGQFNAVFEFAEAIGTHHLAGNDQLSPQSIGGLMDQYVAIF